MLGGFPEARLEELAVCVRTTRPTALELFRIYTQIFGSYCKWFG
jgi:hypothetical protein